MVKDVFSSPESGKVPGREGTLMEAEEEMLHDDKLLPRREDLVRRLNAWAPALRGRCRLKVVFRQQCDLTPSLVIRAASSL
jgi:hypothetical protein